MIGTYDNQTGDGRWLRQSFEILKGEMGMICQNCLEDAGGCICKAIRKANDELLRLKAEWLEIVKTPMPEHIASMSFEKIRFVIDAAKDGVIYGPLKTTAKTPLTDDSSLMDWDRQDMKNGNAYGS